MPLRLSPVLALLVVALAAAPRGQGGAGAVPGGFEIVDPVTVQATDYGVVTGALVNNTPALERAIYAAVSARPPGRWARVVLPPDTTYYRGQLRINADSLQIVGCGGAVVTRDTTSAEAPSPGAVYYPVRRADRVDPGACVSVVRVLPGVFEARGGRGPQPTRWIVWSRGARAARGYHRLALADFVMDGNLAGNLDGLRRIENKKGFLQDGVGHTALAANGHDQSQMCVDRPETLWLPGGRRVRRQGTQVGTLIEVRRVVVTGYAATGLVGDRCTRWRLDTVRAEDSPYNHVLYHTDGGVRWQDQAGMGDLGDLSGWGGATHVTLAGSAWTYWVSQSGLAVDNLVFEGAAPNPLRRNGALVNARFGTVTVNGLTAAAPVPRGIADDTGGRTVVNPGAVPDRAALVLPPGARE